MHANQNERYKNFEEFLWMGRELRADMVFLNKLVRGTNRHRVDNLYWFLRSEMQLVYLRELKAKVNRGKFKVV